MKFKFFELAKDISIHSTHPQHKHSSVIVRKNRVIGQGFNKYKTHPASTHVFKSTHSELAAILSARGKDIRGATVYNFRMRKDGNIANSKPCPFCLDLLKQYEIKDVYYTTENGIEYLNLED